MTGIVTTIASARGRRIEGLDVLRGLAVLAVMLRHSWPNTFGTAGEVGVVMFFALSGYLITGLITKDLDGFGTLRFGRFWVHRAVRLLPALFLMLLGYVVVTLAIDPPLGDDTLIPHSLLIALTYTSDLPRIGTVSGSLSHLWTLAVEEQFYIVWPFLLILGRRFRITWVLVVLAAAAITGALVFSLHHTAPDYLRVYTWPSSWSIAMLIGSAAQLGGDRVVEAVNRNPVVRSVAAVCAGLFLAWMCVYPNGKNDPHTYLVIGPLIAVATTLLTITALRWRRVGQIFAPLLGLGVISYAAYLWDWPIQQWLLATMPDHPRAVAYGAFVLTIIAATVSWFAVERPAKRIRRAFDARRSARRPEVGSSSVIGEAR
jgi:peptidoglycan/LPS O-acetylase OafA/YrhL